LKGRWLRSTAARIASSCAVIYLLVALPLALI
jgi:hypothetical protein